MSSEFTKFLEERYTRPVVVVIASPAAETACRKDGLDVIHLLRPYSVHEGTCYAHIGERGENLKVTNFGVRLVRHTCVREPGEAEILRYLGRTLKVEAPMDLACGEQLDRAVQELMTPPAIKETSGGCASVGSSNNNSNNNNNNNSNNSYSSRPPGVSAGGPLPRPVRLSSSNALTTLLDRSYPTWHSRIVKDISFLTRCSAFDTLDHPVGVISVASTAEPGGLEGCLQILQSQVRLAGEVRNGLHSMDTDLHKYFILLHDVTDPSSPSIDEARRILRAAQQRFSSNNVALVRINSVENPRGSKCMDPTPYMEANRPCLDVPSATAAQLYEEAEAAQSEPTGASALETANNSTSTLISSSVLMNSVTNSRYLRYHGVHGQFGKWENNTPKITACCLSPEDVQELRSTMNYYLSQSLLRHLERRLRAMDVFVEDKRTTTLGRVAAWLKGKEDSKPAAKDIIVVKHGNSTQTMYLATSLEMQMRRCGDLSLALHDYGSAARYYKLCIQELFETLDDRPYNLPLIAACQEAIGVCHYFEGRLALPSVAPWNVGRSQPKVRSNTSVCRLELALNDYDAARLSSYVLRTALLLYEFGRTRTPPCSAASKSIIEYLLRSGWLQQNKLLRAIAYDMLASLSIFSNPPFPSHMVLPVTIASGYGVEGHVRTFVRRLVEAGGLYRESGAPETALRCYLRVLEILRGVGQRGSWSYFYEHILFAVAELYFTLHQDTKGLVALTTSVTLGTPRYRSTKEAKKHLDYFLSQQQRVLQLIGYGLCPHMPIPLIERPSFTIDKNVYIADGETTATESKVGEVAAEQEWDGMEELTKTYYQKNILKKYPAVTFPQYQSDHGKCTYVFREGTDVKSKKKLFQVNVEQDKRSYTIAKTEPLLLSFVFCHTAATPISAQGVCILYLSKSNPDTLWKSSLSQNVHLPPLGSQRITLRFDPLEEGEYVVIGLCWVVEGQQGYYYFASKESRPGHTESLFENALENPTPKIDAEENIKVTVTQPRAWLTSRLEPPLPESMRDGEYFATKLIVTNHSKVNAATHITFQRSPKSAHLIWCEKHSLEENLDFESPSLVAEQLAASSSVEVPLVIRAQHHRGDRQQICHNHIFLLLAYLPVPESQLSTSATKPSVQVRLHRFLRQVRVQPMLALYSTVLPPTNVSMAMAAVFTAKYIPEKGSPSAQLCRVVASHHHQWGVRCAYTGSLIRENGATGVVEAENALTVPLLVNRLPSLIGETDYGEDVMDSDCLSINTVSPGKKEAVLRVVGSTISQSPMNLYYLQTCYKGAGSVGQSAQADMGLAFYLDKGAANAQTEEEKKAAEVALERKSFGDIREQFSPIAITATWLLPPVDGGPLLCGQLFHFIDPMSFLEKRVLLPSPRRGMDYRDNTSHAVDWNEDNDHVTPGSAPSLVNANTSITRQKEEEETYLSGIAEVQSMRSMQELFKTKFFLRQSVNPLVGSLAYFACVQPEVSTSPNAPHYPTATLTVRCLSLAPLPLLVTVTARPPGASHLTDGTVPLIFVGKTRHSFILLPSHTYDVPLTATVLLPGLVNCNVFDVDATPLYFQPSCKVVTGMLPEAYVKELVQQQASLLACKKQLPTSSDGGKEVTVTSVHRTLEALARLQNSGQSGGKEKEQFFQDLIPLGFHRTQLTVEGRQEAVFTNSVFSHKGDEACLARVAERFAKKKNLYQNDYLLFEKEYYAFAEAEKERQDFLQQSIAINNYSMVQAPSQGIEYIYRPPVQVSYVKPKRVKKLSTEESTAVQSVTGEISGVMDGGETVKTVEDAELSSDEDIIQTIEVAKNPAPPLLSTVEVRSEKSKKPMFFEHNPKEAVPLTSYSTSHTKTADTVHYTSMEAADYFAQKTKDPPPALSALSTGKGNKESVTNVFHLPPPPSRSDPAVAMASSSLPASTRNTLSERTALMAPLTHPSSFDDPSQVDSTDPLSPLKVTSHSPGEEEEVGDIFVRQTSTSVTESKNNESRSLGSLQPIHAAADEEEGTDEDGTNRRPPPRVPLLPPTTTTSTNLLDELFGGDNAGSVRSTTVPPEKVGEELDLDRLETNPFHTTSTPQGSEAAGASPPPRAVLTAVTTSAPTPLQGKEELTHNGKWYTNTTRVKRNFSSSGNRANSTSSSSSSSGMD